MHELWNSAGIAEEIKVYLYALQLGQGIYASGGRESEIGKERMKHIFIIETADSISPLPWQTINKLDTAINAIADEILDEYCFTRSTCNQPSAIRAVYRMFHADESKSPDELGSAK